MLDISLDLDTLRTESGLVPDAEFLSVRTFGNYLPLDTFPTCSDFPRTRFGHALDTCPTLNLKCPIFLYLYIVGHSTTTLNEHSRDTFEYFSLRSFFLNFKVSGFFWHSFDHP